MSHLTDEEVLLWLDMIERVTGYVCRDFPDIDDEDVSHELWSVVLLHPSLDVMNPGCFSLMRKKARKIAWRQRKEQLQMHAQYSYTKTDVKRILETSFHYGDWADGWTPIDASSDDDPMAPVEVRSDITRALEYLAPPSYKQAILDRYMDGIVPEVSADKSRLERAVTKLTGLLNWYYDPNSRATHPGRPVVTNAQAAYSIRQQMEGQ